MEANKYYKAIMPDGSIEIGKCEMENGRLVLNEGCCNIHHIDGGFPDGTKFEEIDVYEFVEYVKETVFKYKHTQNVVANELGRMNYTLDQIAKILKQILINNL